MMELFFTDVYNNMSAEEKESLLRTLILKDDSEASRKARHEYYRTHLGAMGKDVFIGSGVKIINPQWVYLGDGVCIEDDVTIIARGPGGVHLADRVHLTERVYLDTEREETGYIHVGEATYIGTGTTLHGHVGLEIGQHVLMAQNITLTPFSHIFSDASRNIDQQDGHCTKVTIEDDVYVGMGVTILYTGNIGKGSIVGAGSVVVKPIPPYSVAVGNPAKVIKERK